MKLRNIIILAILVIEIIINPQICHAQEQVNEDFDPDEGFITPSNTQNAQEYIMQETGAEVTLDTSGSYEYSNGILAADSTSINMKDYGGQSISVSSSGEVTINEQETVSGAGIVSKTSEGVIEIDKADNMEMSGSEPYQVKEVGLLIQEEIAVVNGKNVEYKNGVFSVESADSIKVERGILSVVKNFEGSSISFWVDEAENVMIRCLSIDYVKRTGFNVYKESVGILPSEGVGLGLTDCGGSETSFNASNNASLIVSEAMPVTYRVANGSLQYEGSDYVEWIESFEESFVVMDKYSGFSCMNIMPGGAYFYSSRTDKRKDFSIESPLYGYDYRLCVRKDISQSFTGFDGMIDIPNNVNVLDGTINYYRYPLKNNIIAGVVLEPAYKGFLNPKTTMQLDTQNIFIKNMTVKPHTADKTVTKTYSSKYLTIKESPGRKDTDTRTWTKINPSIIKTDMIDNLIQNYNGMSILNNALFYENIWILSPEHGMIKSILN